MGLTTNRKVSLTWMLFLMCILTPESALARPSEDHEDFETLIEQLLQPIQAKVDRTDRTLEAFRRGLINMVTYFVGCTDGFFVLDGDCINIVQEIVTWETAQRSCKEKGGDLAQPKDVSALNSYLQNNGMVGQYWLGGRKIAREGNWEWLSGRSISSSDWRSGQPDGDGDCVILWPGLGLYDASSTSMYKFICQR